MTTTTGATTTTMMVLTIALLVPRGVEGHAGEYLYIENTVGGDVTVISIPDHVVVSTIPANVVGHER